MKTYSITYKTSTDGKAWVSQSAQIKAETDTGAIEQVKSKAPYVKDIVIQSAR